MDLKLSFILPCYNVERYIADCLNSIYTQNLPEEDYEVICVNDCSTDGTRLIIAEFEEKHSNLTLIDHEHNLTAGGARNTGINHAKGEYIWFVDPDDLIRPNCLSELLRKMEEEKLDILMFNFEDVDENLVPMGDELFLDDSEVMTGQDYVVSRFMGRFNLLGIVWRCIFRTSFIKENNLAYPMIRKSQDVVFIWKALLKANRVQSSRNVYYSFRVNPHSVTHVRNNVSALFSDRIMFGKEVSDILKDDSFIIRPQLAEDLKKTCLWCANSNLELLSGLPKKEWSVYYALMQQNPKAIKEMKCYANVWNKSILCLGIGEREWHLRTRMAVFLKKHR